LGRVARGSRERPGSLRRDLIPSKPLKDAEEKIRNIYQTSLGSLYEKLKKAK
jgi:hypothetical protein